MKEITPTLGLRATEAVEVENKLGVQIGEPVGHSKPPRVYLFIDEFPNGGATAAITQMMESAGLSEAWEIPDPLSQPTTESPEGKAAECVQEQLDGFNPDGERTLFLAGSEKMADEVLDWLNIPEDINIEINVGEPAYIPDPA